MQTASYAATADQTDVASAQVLRVSDTSDVLDELLGIVTKRKNHRCPEGTEFRNGKCREFRVREIDQCPEGTEFRNGRCREVRVREVDQCPEGTEFRNGRCREVRVREVDQCPEGTEF